MTVLHKGEYLSLKGLWSEEHNCVDCNYNTAPVFPPRERAEFLMNRDGGVMSTHAVKLAALSIPVFPCRLNKKPHVAIRRSKTGKPRHVVLTDEGRALFKELSAGHSGHEMMLRRANGEPFRKSDQARPMIEACDRAKIKPRISFHGLRHTWASLAVMNDVPLMVVARNLGHADTRMVEKHYGHLAPSYVAEAIRKGAPRFGFKTDNKIATLRERDNG
jgi:hypothetical protein